jgi:excisionase family DNA binding protein
MLTVREAADRLGIAISTLYDLVRQRKIGHHRVGTGPDDYRLTLVAHVILQ